MNDHPVFPKASVNPTPVEEISLADAIYRLRNQVDDLKVEMKGIFTVLDLETFNTVRVEDQSPEFKISYFQKLAQEVRGMSEDLRDINEDLINFKSHICRSVVSAERRSQADDVDTSSR